MVVLNGNTVPFLQERKERNGMKKNKGEDSHEKNCDCRRRLVRMCGRD